MTKCATPDRFAGLQNCFPSGGLTIQRTLDSQSPALKHMSIDHCCFDILVSEEFLNCADVVAVLEQMGGKGMAKRVRRNVFVDFCAAGGFPDGFLNHCFMQMMTAGKPGPFVFREVRGREKVLPNPIFTRIRILAVKSVRQIDRSKAIRQVFLMDDFYILQMKLQGFDQ